MILGVEGCSGSLVCGATFLNIPNARDPLTFWAGFFPQLQKLRRLRCWFQRCSQLAGRLAAGGGSTCNSVVEPGGPGASSRDIRAAREFSALALGLI